MPYRVRVKAVIANLRRDGTGTRRVDGFLSKEGPPHAFSRVPTYFDVVPAAVAADPHLMIDEVPADHFDPRDGTYFRSEAPVEAEGDDPDGDDPDEEDPDEEEDGEEEDGEPPPPPPKAVSPVAPRLPRRSRR